MNEVARAGEIFICAACGKTSRDRYGYDKADAGWDESCTMHAVLVIEKSIKRNGHGGIEATAVVRVEKIPTKVALG